MMQTSVMPVAPAKCGGSVEKNSRERPVGRLPHRLARGDSVLLQAEKVKRSMSRHARSNRIFLRSNGGYNCQK